jgi:uncharacterized protein YjaZ
MGFGGLAHAQLCAQETIQGHIVELEHNCALALDGKLDPENDLTREIESEVRQVMSRIQSLIPATDLTIHIVLCDSTNEGNIIPFMGIGGHPIGTEAIEMYIQPENPNFKTENVAWGLPHEIHHALRMRRPDWHWSLLECIVMEGLADHFLIEVVGGEAGPWTRALSEEDIHRYLKRLRPQMHTTTESWAEFETKYLTPWLFGRSGNEPIPSFTGYTLGWRIVANYINAHPEASGSSLLYVRAEEIAESTPELLDTE